MSETHLQTTRHRALVRFRPVARASAPGVRAGA
jgi:hypothetical protein